MFWPHLASVVVGLSPKTCTLPEILPSVPKGLCTAKRTAEAGCAGWVGGSCREEVGLAGRSLHISFSQVQMPLSFISFPSALASGS